MSSLASCSFTPDGIDEDAPAPYSTYPHIFLLNTTRALYTVAFDQDNNSLYYEIGNREDENAAGTYERTGETEATITINFDNEDQIEYNLIFNTRNNGTVEEKVQSDNGTITYTGTFTLQ